MSTKPSTSQSCNTQTCAGPCIDNGNEVACPGTTCVCDSSFFDMSAGGITPSCLLKNDLEEDAKNVDNRRLCEDVIERDTTTTTYEYLDVYSKLEFPSDFDATYFNVQDVSGGSYDKVNCWITDGHINQSHSGSPGYWDTIAYQNHQGQTLYRGDMCGDNRFPCLKYPQDKTCYSDISQAAATIRAHFKSRYTNRSKYQFWITYYIFASRLVHVNKFKRISPYCTKTLLLPVTVNGVTVTEGKCYTVDYEDSYTSFLAPDNSAEAKKAVAESFVEAFYKCYVLGVDSLMPSYRRNHTASTGWSVNWFEVPYIPLVGNRLIVSDKDKGLYDQVIISGTNTSMDGTYNNLRASNYARERKWNKNRQLYDYSPLDGAVPNGKSTWDDNDGDYTFLGEIMNENQLKCMFPEMDGWDLSLSFIK